MRPLTTNLDEIYFYIQSKVIYKIASKNDDECAKKGVSAVTSADKEVKVPSIVATETKSGEEKTYFLVDYITDGDTYSKENGFAKHPHTEPGGGGSIANYYKELCKKEMENAIASNPSANYNLFNNNKSLLNIPLFMIVAGHTVQGIDQITFNESEFDKIKKNLAQKAAWKAADNKAHEYNYKVTLDVSGLTITKIEEE